MIPLYEILGKTGENKVPFFFIFFGGVFWPIFGTAKISGWKEGIKFQKRLDFGVLPQGGGVEGL